MIPLPFGETITIVRGAALTFPTYGDAPAPASSVDVEGCGFWEVTTAELVSGQDTVTWDAVAVFPPGTDVLATDTVIARGRTYLIAGQPFEWKSQLTGMQAGIEVRLNTATG